MFASRLWWLLRWLGHDRVAVLNGGIRPGRLPATRSSPTCRRPPPRPSRRGVQNWLRVDADFVLSHLHDPAMLLIDARAPDRFRGENETLDPVAATFPGAINRFFRTTWTPAAFQVGRASCQGRVRQAHQQRRRAQRGAAVRFRRHGLSQPAGDGTAGLSGARLYAGSWSEWCADRPDRWLPAPGPRPAIS